jgi:hypothetical protein
MSEPVQELLPGTRVVTARAVLVGSVCVVLVGSLVPYNDFVFSDNSLGAGFLPLIAVLLQFVLVVVVNAPLHRWAPSRALRRGELGVVVLMATLACAVPNWGVMRFLAPMPVMPFYHGTSDATFWNAFLAMDLPGWLFPVESIEDGRSSPVVNWFYNARPEGESIPWGAWVLPAVGWGVFALATLVVLVCLGRLVLEQWQLNERLPFPLVQVQADLLAEPAPGRGLNDLLRSRSLWIGLGIVAAIHGLTVLNSYQPTYFPRITLGYDFTSLVADGPLQYLRTKVKASQISFMVVGVTYFIRARVAFSLWGVFILVNCVDVVQGQRAASISSAAWADQHLGAAMAFALGIFWIGRHHWARVLRNAFGRGQDSSYRLTFWLAIAGLAVMVGWLVVVGVQTWLAVLIVLFTLLAHLVVARVVAETGIPFYRSSVQVSQVYGSLSPDWFSGRDIWFSGVGTVLGPLTSRDSITVLSQQGLGIADRCGVGTQHRRAVSLLVVWSLLLAVGVSAVATLYCHYTYPTPVSRDVVPQGNNFGAIYVPERDIIDPFVSHAEGRFPPKQHSTPLHVGIGFVITSLLQVGALQFANWPLLPVGFVASHGAFIANVWFSVFLGWLLKVCIVRFGGAGLYQGARPFFVGMLFGEALVAGLWLALNAILVLNGYDSQPIKFLL